jgi:hypothetical protein
MPLCAGLAIQQIPSSSTIDLLFIMCYYVIMSERFIHDVYPSSKVCPTDIEKYGWFAIEELPTSINKHGRPTVSDEQSEIHRSMSFDVAENCATTYAARSGEVFTVADFAVAETSPGQLSIFGLKQAVEIQALRVAA